MPPAVMIDLQGHSTGRVCVTEICDLEDWTDTTYKRYTFKSINNA
jgi:hypothetical protein